MTVERYWNDKLCRSLMSPNITGGPVARLSDLGHLGWNDSGMTIGTTFEQKLKRLRWLNQFLRSYGLVCLSVKPKISPSVWQSQLHWFDMFLQISNFQMFQRSKKNAQKGIRKNTKVPYACNLYRQNWSSQIHIKQGFGLEKVLKSEV